MCEIVGSFNVIRRPAGAVVGEPTTFSSGPVVVGSGVAVAVVSRELVEVTNAVTVATRLAVACCLGGIMPLSIGRVRPAVAIGIVVVLAVVDEVARANVQGCIVGLLVVVAAVGLLVPVGSSASP